MKIQAIEQYFPVVLFCMLYKVVLIFELVNEILKCPHSNASYGAVLYYGAAYLLCKVVLTFKVCGEIKKP